MSRPVDFKVGDWVATHKYHYGVSQVMSISKDPDNGPFGGSWRVRLRGINGIFNAAYLKKLCPLETALFSTQENS